MKNNNFKMCLACSSGGHLYPLYILKPLWQKYARFWVTFDKIDAWSLLQGETVYTVYHPTNRNIKNLIRNSWLALKILLKEKPNIIISTGAAVAVPFFYLGKLLKIKLIYIEVYDRINSPTLTGKLVYPIVDAFVVQWDEQKRFYPKGINLGGIIMIFVTVGTHEQQHDRLVSKVDELIGERHINEEVFIQRGYSKYIPRNCPSEVLLPYEVMDQYYRNSRIVITHGGPCSIIQAMMYGKVPIVVPRMPSFDEHVDDHQIQFTEFLEKRNKILAIYEISKLSEIIANYAEIIANLVGGYSVSNSIENNIGIFSTKLDNLCFSLLTSQ